MSGAAVVDFWRFALPDLRVNSTRGVFAEFLVHRAVGSHRPRVEWASHDVETDDGIRIEVKASGYLQAWDQNGPSDIRFSGLRARTWTPDHGYAPTASYNADVYVFAVETAREPALYDPLDTSQWEFYVLPRPALVELAAGSLGLNTVRRAAGPPVPFAGLGNHIRAAAPTDGPASEARPAARQPPG
ncbi:hypothetical protein [Actinacidiphila yanglinensis]|uniref:hypothetical protein n=1 Tax=Actinacidiphila yanglinensis TaxID=310779 RepID=UPI000CDF23AB|nr:hypothetical protein [Actinacidiphila yanglinensis]